MPLFLKRPLCRRLSTLRGGESAAMLLIAILLSLSAVPAVAEEPIPAAEQLHPLYLRLRLNDPVKAKNLKVGDVLEGKLALDVYSENQQVFAAGSPVRLTIDGLATRKKVPNDHWPWVFKVFLPRHEKYPTFKSATVETVDHRTLPLDVNLISIGEKVEVHPKTQKENKQSDDARRKLGPTVVLTAQQNAPLPAGSGTLASLNPVTLPSGTTAHLVLLDAVSAGKSRAGDAVDARLIEPIRVDQQIVIPEGAVFHGSVAKSSPPKMLSRAGSLFLSFTSVSIPGKSQPVGVEAIVSQVDRDERSHTILDPEGDMHGGHAGKAWILANIGVTAGLAKVSDDTAQLIVEAISSTATDASTAGTARIAAAVVGGVFILTRHGRDVVLPQYNEMQVTLSRPATVPPRQ